MRSIHGVALTVVSRPAAAVESLDFLRSGASGLLTPRFDIATGEPTRRTWIVAFDDSLDATSGEVEIGEIQLRVAAGVEPGSFIELELATTSALSNRDGSVLETVANGDLILSDGRVDVTAAGCATSTKLCLLEDRFEIEVTWKDFAGNQGAGRSARLAADSGSFWFFNPENVELVVKVLDGRAINGNFWVFYGALSNVEFSIAVTDTLTGEVKTYRNPSGSFASVGDTSAFEGTSALAIAESPTVETRGAYPEASRGRFATPKAQGAVRSRSLPQSGESARLGDLPGPGNAVSFVAGTCLSDDTHLCSLDRRFRLSVAWTDFAGSRGVGRARQLTDETGYFWFFGPNNIEIVVKVLDAQSINGSFWVFYGALTNVAFSLEVLDTVTGIQKTYQNSSGVFASVGDTSAFPFP